MDSPLATVALPAALAIIMFGLGLSLTTADFARVARHPRVVTIALACQLLILPAIAFGLVLLFDLPPLLAVGMMVLAASPGGTTANLFSHLYRGDVALNITLTAVNSVIAVVTLPVVTNFALGYFDPDTGTSMGLQFGKVLQVFAIVLIPVAVGMFVRARWTDFAHRMDKPVRIASAVVLVLVTIAAENENVGSYLADVGLITTLFCLASLAVGYWVPKVLGAGRRQSIACSMEIGVHNSTLAIAISISVLDSVDIAIPGAVYGVVMFPLAAAVGWLISRGTPAATTETAQERTERAAENS